MVAESLKEIDRRLTSLRDRAHDVYLEDLKVRIRSLGDDEGLMVRLELAEDAEAAAFDPAFNATAEVDLLYAAFFREFYEGEQQLDSTLDIVNRLLDLVKEVVASQ